MKIACCDTRPRPRREILIALIVDCIIWFLGILVLYGMHVLMKEATDNECSLIYFNVDCMARTIEYMDRVNDPGCAEQENLEAVARNETLERRWM
jgi:hypothetical protein